MSKTHVKMVGPVVRDPDIADALGTAIEADNPGVEIMYEETSAYTRIHTPRICRITYDSLQEALGRPFHWFEITNTFVSFAGRLKTEDEKELVFYLEREE